MAFPMASLRFVLNMEANMSEGCSMVASNDPNRVKERHMKKGIVQMAIIICCEGKNERSSKEATPKI